MSSDSPVRERGITGNNAARQVRSSGAVVGQPSVINLG
jgi:hypothetical protein